MDFKGLFNEKVAVVTGGASGMGEASARLLHERGATVVVVDRDPRAGEVANELGGVAGIGDVSSSEFCDELIQGTAAKHGSVDILVNAAGIIVRSPAHETSDEDWDRIMAVNVGGVFRMSRAAVGQMLKQDEGGAIVNFGSVWGDVGNVGHAAYAATKGAVHQLTRSMALEHARDKIRINAVAPGEIRTPMLSSGRDSTPTEVELQAIADATVPMARLGDPAEVAAAVAFLASDEASYITGAILAVDAGYGAQ